MTRLLSSWNYSKWIIETHLDNIEDYRSYIPNNNDNRTIETATNNGYQHYFGDEIQPLAEIVRNRANSVLAEMQSPVRAGDLDKSWSIQYEKGGWQAMHNHADPFTIISCIIYFDTNPSENTSAGALYAMLAEPDGSENVLVFPYWAGKMIMIEGNVFHGTYPTEDTRDIMVFDFKQEIINDPNNEEVRLQAN